MAKNIQEAIAELEALSPKRKKESARRQTKPQAEEQNWLEKFLEVGMPLDKLNDYLVNGKKQPAIRYYNSCQDKVAKVLQRREADTVPFADFETATRPAASEKPPLIPSNLIRVFDIVHTTAEVDMMLQTMQRLQTALWQLLDHGFCPDLRFGSLEDRLRNLAEQLGNQDHSLVDGLPKHAIRTACYHIARQTVKQTYPRITTPQVHFDYERMLIVDHTHNGYREDPAAPEEPFFGEIGLPKIKPRIAITCDRSRYPLPVRRIKWVKLLPVNGRFPNKRHLSNQRLVVMYDWNKPPPVVGVRGKPFPATVRMQQDTIMQMHFAGSHPRVIADALSISERRVYMVIKDYHLLYPDPEGGTDPGCVG